MVKLATILICIGLKQASWVYEMKLILLEYWHEIYFKLADSVDTFEGGEILKFGSASYGTYNM